MIYTQYDYSYDSQEEMLAEIERQDKEQQQAYLRSLEIKKSKPNVQIADINEAKTGIQIMVDGKTVLIKHILPTPRSLVEAGNLVEFVIIGTIDKTLNQN
jgi:hypothetical protein